jgi:hypothetical protein
MELWELVARESIRDLVARYNANGDSGRIASVLDLFVEDATLEVAGSRVYRGLSEIRELFEGAAAGDPVDAGHTQPPPPSLLRHHTSTHQIDLQSEEQASGRCYFVVFTEAGPDHWGRYVDEYLRAGDRWMFRSRCVTVESRVPGGWGDSTNRRLHGR